MKRLCTILLCLCSLALQISAATDGKFTYSYPDKEEDLPYNLGYQYPIFELDGSEIGWTVMEINDPVTLTYNITSEEDKTVEVIFDPSYLELKDIVIPDKVIDSDTGTEYTVKAIGKMAFDDCPEIRSVIMGDSITRIEDYAFNMCENKVLHQIGYVKFSKNLTHIGNYAFRNCHNLTTGYYREGDQQKLQVLNYVKNIDYPFYGYAGRLTGLDNYLLLPASVEYIGKHAFEGCHFEKEGNGHLNYGLCKVKIPNPSCVIDDYAFAGCKFLELITIGEGLTSDGLKYPTPETTKKGRIGAYAFANCNLMRLDIPSSIESIGENAFINCFNRSKYHTPRTSDGRVYFDDVNWFYPRSLFNNDADRWHNWNFYGSDEKNKALVKECDEYLDRWHTNTVTIHSENTHIGNHAFADNPELEKVFIKGPSGEIGSETFRNCSLLRKVELPEGLTKLSSGMFKNCSVLDTINIPESVTELGDSVFYMCKRLVTLELPSGLEKVNAYTFYGCEWLELHTLPARVRSIGNYAFYGCQSFTTFDIPGNVTTIGDYAFADCFLHAGRIKGGVYQLYYGLTHVNIGDGVTSIGAHAFDGCRHLGQIEFGNSVKTIGDYAFLNCMNCPEEDHDPDKYTAAPLKLPDNITAIGKGAFQGCSDLPTVDLSDGMTELPDFAFAYCDNLTSVTNFSTIETISKSAFLGCYNLENLDDFLTQEGLVDGIYYNESKTEVISALPNITEAKILDGVVKIHDGAFAGCGALTEIRFPESIEYIGSHAFENCISLTSAELFNVEMGDSVYAGCLGIEEVIIRDDFEQNIKDNWFAGCFNMYWIEVESDNRLYSSESGMLLDKSGETLLRAPSGIGLYDYVEIPSSVIRIGEYAFSNCIELWELDIPETVTHVGSHAFDGCYKMEISRYGYPIYSGLECVTFYNPAVTIGEYAFNNCKSLAGVFWEEGISREELVEAGIMGSIGAHAFNGCEEMDFTRFFNIQDAVIDTVEPYAFANLSNLGEIELPETVETIGDHAFEGCEILASMILPENLKSIGAHAFNGCQKLSSVEFPEGLKRIGQSAFKSAGLRFLNLPDAIEEVGDSAFMNCSNIMELHLPSSLKKINPYTFYNCFSGAFDEQPEENFNLSVEIPKGVKSIGDYAFYGCAADFHVYYGTSKNNPYSTTLRNYYKYGLTSVSIGEDVETIGAHAFDGCFNLVDVKMSNALTSIGDYAFKDCFKERFRGLRRVEYVLPGIIEKDLDYYPVIWQLDDSTPQAICLPDGLQSLGEGAFSGCAELPSINFPGTLTVIPDKSFNGCKNIPEIKLPEGIRSIGEGAFGECRGVAEIHIPASLETGSRVFVDCDTAYNVYYYAENPKTFDEAFFSPRVYSSNKSVVYAPNAPLDSLKGRTPWALFYRIVAKDETLVHLERALETKNGLRFRILSNKPTPYCEVAGPVEVATEPTSYIVPEYVVNTDPTSEYYLKEYKVIRIGNDAFENDLTLVGIDIPEGVVEIGQEAFNGCKNLLELTLPSTVSNMCERAFANCYGLTYFEVPPLVTRLNQEVLRDCRGLYSIKMHDNIEELCTGALMDCRHLRQFERSDNWKLRLIDDYALKNCIELENINIPEGVQKIGREAMYYCQKLKIVSLPKTLEQLGENTFDDCEVLTTIKVYTETPPKTIGQRNLTDQNCKIYVQAKCLDAFREHWQVHEHRIEPGIVLTQPARGEMPKYVPGDTYQLTSAMPLGGQTMEWSAKNGLVGAALAANDGTIELKGVGRTAVHVETNEGFYHDCILEVYPTLTDANWDGEHDISDAVHMANYAVYNRANLNNWWQTGRRDFSSEGDWNGFYYVGSDVNGDSDISFADASATVKRVLQQPVEEVMDAPANAPRQTPGEEPDALVVGNSVSTTSAGMTFPVLLDNSQELVALQANIRVPEGMSITNVQIGSRADSHTLSSRRVDDRTMRVVIFDLEGTPFRDDHDDPVMYVTVKGGVVNPEDIQISGIVAADESATSHKLTTRLSPIFTGLTSVTTSGTAVEPCAEGFRVLGAEGMTVAVIDLEGHVLMTFTAASDNECVNIQPGFYVVTAGNDAHKVIVKN